MIALLVIGILAGVIAGISPCVLPVLPVVLVAGAARDARADRGARRGRRRAAAVVAGIVVSFTVVTLAGSALLGALGLPQDLLRDAGIAVLALLGLGLLLPLVGERLAAVFARVRVPEPRADLGAFVLGLGTGAVFVPCAGPVLATISLLGTTRRVGAWTVLLTLAFAIGAGIPLLFVALAGDSLVRRTRLLRARMPTVRRVGGVVMLVVATAIALNWTDGLQRAVPGYTNALQSGIENSALARDDLDTLKGIPTPGSADATLLSDCVPQDPAVEDCGPAPNFRDITAWLNTAHGRPLDLADLRGKVVLVDFWTYSCINCQRELPHVEAWYRRYRDDGLVVVGVSTPEFAFEHVVSNVRAAARALKVTYPIAIDDDDATWEAYDNEVWPADYLVDAEGIVRHVQFGEGQYGLMERFIRMELRAADPHRRLPPPTQVADLTPTEATTPESYLGYERLDNLASETPVVDNRPAHYRYPPGLSLDTLALSGTWTVGPQAVVAGPMAMLELHFEARDVYLVLGGTGSLIERVGSGAARTIKVSGIPRLYTLVHGAKTADSTVTLAATPGVHAYDFTFG